MPNGDENCDTETVAPQAFRLSWFDTQVAFRTAGSPESYLKAEETTTAPRDGNFSLSLHSPATQLATRDRSRGQVIPTGWSSIEGIQESRKAGWSRLSLIFESPAARSGGTCSSAKPEIKLLQLKAVEYSCRPELHLTDVSDKKCCSATCSAFSSCPDGYAVPASKDAQHSLSSWGTCASKLSAFRCKDSPEFQTTVW